MKRCKYKAKIPFEIIVRGNEFIKDHPSIEVEDYLRALVVLYSSDSFDANLATDEFFGKEVDFSFNVFMGKHLEASVREYGIRSDEYIRKACIYMSRALISNHHNLTKNLNLILRSL